MSGIESKRYGEDVDDDVSNHKKGLDYRKFQEEGKSGWEAQNTLKPEDLKKQDELSSALREFQANTGIDESKYLTKLKNCTQQSELNELERKFKKAATKWYRTQMQKSGAFDPLDVREETLINKELNELVEAFNGLPFAGEMSMVSVLSEIEETITAKKAFRTKLKKQSKFVQSEYFRRLGSLALVGSKEKLLENVLKELKEVEDSPSAVQYEFKKIQKSAAAGKNTTELKAGILKTYKQKSDAYKKEVLDNLEYFGGDSINTPLGKIPEAAWEFLEWFEERDSFAAMDDAAKKLPTMVKQRKRLIETRDETLKHCNPDQAKKLTEKTNRMRRHELEEFLPEMEQLVRKNNVHTAEYIATLTTARVYNVDLFQPLEKIINTRKFKLNDLETQKAKLIVMQEEIKDREQTVREYFALPSYLRNDESFLKANSYEREKLVHDAHEQLYREQKNPFDTSNVDHLDSEDIQETKEQLEGDEGEDVMEDILKDMTQEGLLKAANLQKNTHAKIFGAAKKAENHDESQKQHYLRDLKYWVRMNQDVKDESDVTTERERSKWRYIQAANEAYDEGYVFTSGGQVRELEELDAQDLKNGGELANEKLKRARYGEHVKVKDHEGKMARDPLEMIEQLSAQELMKLVLVAINKLGKQHMKLGESNMQMLRNSSNIKKTIGTRMVEMEMTQLEGANNNDYLNQLAA